MHSVHEPSTRTTTLQPDGHPDESVACCTTRYFGVTFIKLLVAAERPVAFPKFSVVQ
jgi:hypothetical protein